VLSMARAACAEVINHPTDGATVNGTITVTAQINAAWWSKLWVDGKGITVSGIGNVSFTWYTSFFANGTHTLQVDAYPSDKPANGAETMEVIVNNRVLHRSGISIRFPPALPYPTTRPAQQRFPGSRKWFPTIRDRTIPNLPLHSSRPMLTMAMRGIPTT